MHIVLYNVTTGFKSGGIETYNWEMARALLNQGHQTRLVTGSGDRIKFKEVPVTMVPFTARKEFWNLGWINRRFGSALRKYLERRSFAQNAREVMNNLRPDCIVIFKPYDFGFMRALKKHHPDLLVVFRSGGKDYFYTDQYNKGLVDVWVSCSVYNQQQIERRYKKEVQVIPHGVATDVFKPGVRDEGFRRRHRISETAILTIGIGRLVKWKGFQTAIRAIAAIDDVEMILIGTGGYQRELKRMAVKFGVEQRVHFIGELDNYEIPYYLQQSDVYLHPSLGEEAFGITLLEAMACGLPVIGSDRGAVPEVVGTVTGKIVPAADVESWVSAIRFVRDNDKARREMGQAALQRVIRNYSWDKSASRLVEAVERARARRANC